MKQIKIYGERNSGTIYLEWLLKNNFNIELLDKPITGWKHRIAPSKEEISSLDNDICYVCLVKNPYSWLLSMQKRPKGHDELKNLRFRKFLICPYGDYRNPIIMWNLKNQSYIDLGTYTKNHVVVLYEDLLQDISPSLNSIAQKFGLEIPPIYKNIQSKLTSTTVISGSKFHPAYYLKEKWKQKLKPIHIDIINEFLDKELMDKLNYTLL